MDELAYFTLQLGRPATGWGHLQDVTAHARKATEQLTEEGRRIRFVRSVFVPEDDTCFHLYEASSADDVREAARRADLAFGELLGAVRLPAAVTAPREGTTAPYAETILQRKERA